jgi:hypothetical protein
VRRLSCFAMRRVVVETACMRAAVEPGGRRHDHCLCHGFSSSSCYGLRYTRELRADQVTHLIVLEPNGPKYDVAAQFPKRISIVSPAWLDASAKARQRVNEQEFLFQNNPLKRKLSEMEHGDDDISSRIEDLLAPRGNDSTLFSKAFFHLVGWDCTDKEHRAISVLIRRFWGTIMWEMSDEAITHVIAKDDALDEPTRYERMASRKVPSPV